ncbi:MAG: hypothetical protein M4579_005086 [Chaenotheca gracillima]|nr:MAG: hypothetical protein M4579_005086 [Chaenotheca gracillima]
MKLFGALLLPVLAAAGPLASRSGTSPTVKTSNGDITGHPAINRTDVVEYLGIPFAQPPVGSLRFEPPQKYTGNGALIASKYSAYVRLIWSCPATPGKPIDYPDQTAQAQRIVMNFGDQRGNTESEDCLTLNIWSKASDKKNKPVMVFFYGGRWSIGETNTPFYSGQYLADAEDVIVVTVNYRMNIFGFAGAPGLTQNAGLLDQRLATEWVRDNIAAFDGDASKITIFGQSCGSAAVDYWAYAYQDDPIASGIISHSGNALSFPVNSPQLAEQHWYAAASMLGCGSSGDVLACMRSVSFEDLEAVTPKIAPPPQSSQARSQPVFQPSPDNITVFDDYLGLTIAGKFARLPYMLGNNDNEAGYYKYNAFAKGTILPNADWDDFNAEDFTCPNALQSLARFAYNVPVYRFRYFGDWDNIRLYPNSSAYHGSDIELIFGASQDVSGIPESAAQTQLQSKMMHAWASFADDPSNGITTNSGWPRYNPLKPTLISLGEDNSANPAFIDPLTFDKKCFTLDMPLGALNLTVDWAAINKTIHEYIDR